MLFDQRTRSWSEEMLRLSGIDGRLLCDVFPSGTPLGDETGSESLKAGGDKAKAREMLKAAGYDNTPVVILQPTDIGAMGSVPVVVASELREAGFNVDLQVYEWAGVVERRAKPAEWEMFATGHVFVPDPALTW